MNAARPSLALAAVVACLAVPVASAAAEPTASAAVGDPRSAGEGPGLVGEPLLAIAAVIAIALLAVVLTTVWVRMTAPREHRE